MIPTTTRRKARRGPAFCVPLHPDEVRLLKETAQRTQLSQCQILREGLRLAASQLRRVTEPAEG